jgi:hypothetical protein
MFSAVSNDQLTRCDEQTVMPKSKEWFIWVIAASLLMMGSMKVNLQPPIREGTSDGKCAVTDYN